MQEQLKARGLANDPHSNIYKDILSVMVTAPAATAGDLLRDFSRLEANDYPMLRDFQTHVQVARHQLIQSGCDVGDKVAIWFVLNGLQARYPSWHRSLVRQMHSNKLSWSWLLVEMASEAFHEDEIGGPGGNGEHNDMFVFGLKNEMAEDAHCDEIRGSVEEGEGNRSKRPRIE